MASVGRELDSSLSEWAENLSLPVQRSDAHRSVEFSIEVPGTDRRVEIGHANDVHIWLMVDNCWRVDSHADDLESLMFDWMQFLELAGRVLRGTADPPPVTDPQTRQSWFIPDLELYLRFQQGR